MATPRRSATLDARHGARESIDLTADILATEPETIVLSDDEEGNAPLGYRDLAPEGLTEANPSIILDEQQELGSDVDELETTFDHGILFPFGGVTLDQVGVNGMSLAAGVNVELEDGDFLRITQVIQDLALDTTILLGNLFRRNSSLLGMLDRLPNEITMMLETKSGPYKDPEPRECIIARPVESVVAIRTIVVTNQPYPAFQTLEQRQKKEWRRDHGVLVCRRRYTRHLQVVGKKATLQAESVLAFAQDACDAKKGIASAPVLRRWTNARSSEAQDLPPNKVQPDRKRKIETIDLTSGNATALRNFSEERSLSGITERRKPFTYVDGCVGAGGAASGAQQAGLDPKVVFDQWSVAIETLKMNFNERQTKLLQTELHEFCTSAEFRCCFGDVMHVSTPCQYLSPAHTVAGHLDPENIAAQFCVKELLERVRPRVASFEQTPGITFRYNGDYCRALYRQIHSAGFTFRSKICKMAEHGVPSIRSRFILLAACPGEVVPPFPKPTHGPGLRPFVTIQDAITGLPRSTPAVMRQAIRRYGQPYDGRTLAKTLTTSSSSTIHPSGSRTFTAQELAAIQTFPRDYKFAGTKTAIAKQIGNAVPTVYAKAMFEEIIKSLRNTDRENAAWKQEVYEVD